MFAESINSEQISNLPKMHFEGKIVVAQTPQEVDLYLREIVHSPIAGFDTETKPSFKRGTNHQVALLQLAVPNFALLIRVNLSGLPTSLVRYLEDDRFIKVGAAIRDDIKGLKRYFPFEPKGFIDLQTIVNGYGIHELSVRKMAAIVLGERVSKSQQLSNWEAELLTESQMQYAATDAWASRQIYMKLINNR